MNEIKIIVFDVGNVLIDFHWDKTMRELGISEAAIKHLGVNMIGNPMWKHMDKNDIPEKQIIEKFKEISPQYAEYIDLFFNNMENVVTTYPGTDEWLKELKERGYTIYLLSNYPERMFKMHMKNRFTFMPYVDGRLVSYEVKMIKPDKEIYETLMERYSFAPENAVFLDDRQDNIDAAIECGMHGIVVETQEKAKRKLDALLAYDDMKKELLDNSEEKYREFSQSLTPNSYSMLGVRIPVLRQIAKRIAQGDWESYLEIAEDTTFEEVMLQGYVIGYAKMDIEQALLYAEKYIPKINDWALNDGFCSTFKKATKNRERVMEFLKKYAVIDSEFAQRVVAVMLMDYYLTDDYIDEALDMLADLKADGYYRMMGVAWAVATAYAKYPDETYSFLLQNRLDAETHNKAIQKANESYRVSKEDKEKLNRIKR